MPRHANPQMPVSADEDAVRWQPYIQSLLTYLRQPAFGIVALALGASFVLVALIHQLNLARIPWLNQWLFRISNNIVWLLFLMLIAIAPLALSVVLAMMLIAQLREHLSEWPSRIFPRYHRPHIFAGTLTLALTSVAISAAFSITIFGFNGIEEYLGTLAVVTTLITSMAWAGVRWSLALGPLALALLMLAIVPVLGFFHPSSNWITPIESRWIGWFMRTRKFVASIAPICCLALSAAEILLLPWLLRSASERAVARLGTRKWPILSPRQPAPTKAPAEESFFVERHQIVRGVWARAWHRRRAALPQGAAAWVGIVLCAILMLGPLLSLPRPEPTLIFRGLLLATLTPGIVAAGIWRERWPVLGLESLFPGRRRNFVWESLLSMAMNIAEVWLAGAAAAVVAAALFHPEPWSFAAFGLSLLASALVQMLVLGVLFVLTPFRATTPYLVIMTLLMLAIASPFELAWVGKPELSVESLLAIAAAVAALGAMLAIAGQALWNAFELA